jgi:hypothetical protein
MFHLAVDAERERAGDDVTFYSYVESDNTVSNYYHKRVVRADLCTTFRIVTCLNRCVVAKGSSSLPILNQRPTARAWLADRFWRPAQ